MNYTPIEQNYIESLSEKERKALEIARIHLGSLFTLHKTAGFIQWQKKQQNNTHTTQ